jgi:hypothetical protein
MRAALPDRLASQLDHERPFPGAPESLDDGRDQIAVLVDQSTNCIGMKSGSSSVTS